VAYEVVPGVTSPLGIAAYTGVPLTHREHTSVVCFATGHDVSAVDWARVAGSETLVIFMGLYHLPQIAKELIAAGRPADTPAMAVQWGTRSCQRTIAGTLADLPGRVAAEHLTPPATIIIGAVVALRDTLSWYEKLPLHGQQVIVTRARTQSDELVSGLHELGADVIELPVIEMVEPEDTSALDACIARLEEYDWIVFTSANAVEFLARRIDDVRRLRGRICAIGAATRQAVETLRIRVDLLPEEGTAEGVAAAFEHVDMSGKRVLFPRASAALEVVPSALANMRAVVDAPETYRNVVPQDAHARVQAYLASGHRAGWITFTSPSTVSNFLSIAGLEALDGLRVATIGPTTSEAARRHGLNVDAEAKSPSVVGLIEAITRCNL
jgi:uroporphyrinogen III methyltransferase/synthase